MGVLALPEALERVMAAHGDRLALVDDERSLTWGDVGACSRAAAQSLRACELPDGSTVAILAPNDAMAFVAVIAAIRASLPWISLNARAPVEANAHLLRMAGSGVLFFHSAFEESARELGRQLRQPGLCVCLDREIGPDIPSLEHWRLGDKLPPIKPDDDRIMTVFPTGGTTGLSKGAQWTQRTWRAVTHAFWDAMPFDGHPVHLAAAPMTHAAGVLALAMTQSAPFNILLPKPDPLTILRRIEQRRVTHLYLPPTLIYRLLAHPEVRRFDTSSLRYFLTAAAPIAPDKLREAMDIFGPVMCQCYGQAEAPMFLTFLSARDVLEAPAGDRADRWASCGRPTGAAEVRIAGTEHPAAPFERGEIVARGNLVMAGYRGRTAADSGIVDGWLHTGDIGYRDEDGFLYIVDRAKDMIITGGFNVYSAEVEQVLLSHPAVAECAVIGVPDPEWGEAVKAVVELRWDRLVDAPELQARVRAALGGVHVPKSIDFWAELPRSPNGKVLKRAVREAFWPQDQRQV